MYYKHVLYTAYEPKKIDEMKQREREREKPNNFNEEKNDEKEKDNGIDDEKQREYIK